MIIESPETVQKAFRRSRKTARSPNRITNNQDCQHTPTETDMGNTEGIIQMMGVIKVLTNEIKPLREQNFLGQLKKGKQLNNLLNEKKHGGRTQEHGEKYTHDRKKTRRKKENRRNSIIISGLTTHS